jgi:hypothetical protein
MGEWRIRFDTPGPPMSVVPAHVRSKSFSDFAPQSDSFSGTYREPATGLVGLQPSYANIDNYASSVKGLANWRTGGMWMDVRRANLDFHAWTNILAHGASAEDNRITCTPYLVQSLGIGTWDELVWLAESKFTIPRNAGFSFVLMTIADELEFGANLCYVMWDRIGVHFANDGIARVYYYEGSITQVPTLIHSFPFAEANDIVGHIMRVNFIPIPGMGLAIHVLRDKDAQGVKERSVKVNASRAELVPFRSYVLGDGWTMTNPALLRWAANPFFKWVVAFQSITYPTSGYFADATFDPGLLYAVAPDFAEPIFVPIFGSGGSATASVERPDLSGSYTPGTDRQARTKVILSTTNTSDTPWVAGWDVAWPSTVVARTTTPKEPDILKRFEYTKDENNNGEGTADVVFLDDAGRAIAFRGDTTFTLERRNTATSPWVAYDGGYAKDWRPTHVYAGDATHIKATCNLKGIWERFREKHCTQPTLYDGLSVADAINRVLYGAGFSMIADADMPDAAKYTNIPPYGGATRPRWAPHERMDAADLARCLLLHLKNETDEYRLWYDWANLKWVLDLRPRAGTLWTLVPRKELEALAPSNVARWAPQPTFIPTPPECNLLIVEGASQPDSTGGKFVNYMKNGPSMTDITSVDYLGRDVIAIVQESLIESQDSCDIWLRRIYDACAHRRVTGTLDLRQYHAVLPMHRANVYDDDGDPLFTQTFYVKKVTHTMERAYGENYTAGIQQERTTVEIDDMFDSELGV